MPSQLKKHCHAFKLVMCSYHHTNKRWAHMIHNKAHSCETLWQLPSSFAWALWGKASHKHGLCQMKQHKLIVTFHNCVWHCTGWVSSTLERVSNPKLTESPSTVWLNSAGNVTQTFLPKTRMVFQSHPSNPEPSKGFLKRRILSSPHTSHQWIVVLLAEAMMLHQSHWQVIQFSYCIQVSEFCLVQQEETWGTPSRH